MQAIDRCRDPALNDRPACALRALVRLTLADCVFLAASAPSLEALGIAEVLAFLTGLLWLVPVDSLLLWGSHPATAEVCATCAIRAGPAAAGSSAECLIGTIETVIG